MSFESFDFEFSHVIDGSSFIHHSSIDGLHYLAPFIDAFNMVHNKFGLTSSQADDLCLPMAWQNQPHFYMEFAKHLVSSG